MSKIAARNLDVTVNSVALEGFIDSYDLNIKPETPVVTTFADAGPRRVQGNYDWDQQFGGSADFASGQSDASIFALVAAGLVAQTIEPTGSAAGADTPTYTGSALLSNYGLKWGIGQGAKYSASMVGGSALTRNVA